MKEALVIAIGIVLGLGVLGIGIMNSERCDLVSANGSQGAAPAIVSDKAFGRICVYGSSAAIPEGYEKVKGEDSPYAWACTPSLNTGAWQQIVAMIR